MRKRRGRVDLDQTRAQLEHVGLVHAAESLGTLLEEAVKAEELAHPRSSLGVGRLERAQHGFSQRSWRRIGVPEGGPT